MSRLICVLALGLFLGGNSCNDERTTDNGRIYRANVAKVVYPRTQQELLEVIAEARDTKRPIIAAGKRHSQGGQSFCEDGISVDLTKFNQIIELNAQAKWIVVQSGVSWEQIQEAVNPYGLSVKVMQSSNIFTVGGSISVNAHGRDPRFSSLSSTIEAIKFLSADGNLRWIDRQNEPELFSLVISGYGLFGFIVEAKISLTDNWWLDKKVKELTPADYLDFFQSNIVGNEDVNLHFARFYVGKDAPLSKMISVSYYDVKKEITTAQLWRERNVALNKCLFNFLRKTDLGKRLAWRAQVKSESKPLVISRNNAMRPEILALEYNSPKDTDILQEYFVPRRHFAAFTRDIQKVLRRYPINLLNITVRSTMKNTDAVLSYANEDSFAFVFYANVGLSQEAQNEASEWTRELIDAAHSYGGSFYLPYQRYATHEQILAAYPRLPYFLEQKRLHDPQMLFQSDFFKLSLAPPV